MGQAKVRKQLMGDRYGKDSNPWNGQRSIFPAIIKYEGQSDESFASLFNGKETISKGHDVPDIKDITEKPFLFWVTSHVDGEEYATYFVPNKVLSIIRVSDASPLLPSNDDLSRLKAEIIIYLVKNRLTSPFCKSSEDPGIYYDLSPLIDNLSTNIQQETIQMAICDRATDEQAAEFAVSKAKILDLAELWDYAAKEYLKIVLDWLEGQTACYSYADGDINIDNNSMWDALVPGVTISAINALIKPELGFTISSRDNTLLRLWYEDESITMSNEIGKLLERYKVYEYHHIDDDRCLSPLKTAFDNCYGISFSIAIDGTEQCSDDDPYIQVLENHLKDLFGQAGWEGDGQITCIHVPPFLLAQDYGSHCRTVFHVKQSHRGTSFLAFDYYDLGLSEQIVDQMQEKRLKGDTLDQS